MTIVIEQDEETGWFTAHSDDPKGGGFTTQAKTLLELLGAINEATRCHFGEDPTPEKSKLHFVSDPILQRQYA